MSWRWSPASVLILLVAASVLLFVLYGLTAAPEVSSHSADSAMSATISLRSLLCVSLLAARRGGIEVKNVHEKLIKNVKSKDGSLKNPVTDGDMRSHHAMLRTLKDAFPHLKVTSEEHDPEAESQYANVHVGPADIACPEEVSKEIPDDTNLPVRDLHVWIDPLDATQEYTESLLNYVTTMVGIAVNGKAVAGVIHKPFEDMEDQQTFWAWKDHGISPNLQPPTTSSSSNIKVIVSRSHSGDVDEVARKGFAGKSIEVLSAGGAGYKTLEVAAGRASVYLHTTKIKKWDLCAPNGILNALGGRLSSFDGDEIDYSPGDAVHRGGVIAAHVDHAMYLDIFTSLSATSFRFREDS
ncbi:hypothetical protein RvY_07726 [Ramazzottius varieornatus]|uniref:inositol-phosphate phosphatase n=1 Tax=Ramazzottius varieornatus TaxID=947166 RepID=A0A1D1V677_RAMVA|nr:hypothetical protein RvY_07726 [Ramazzottius varieornatus]